MQINRAKFDRVVKEAKAKTTDRRWMNAIEKVADAIINDKWIITELQHCIVVTTESGKTYRANGHCQCEAFFRARRRRRSLKSPASKPRRNWPSKTPSCRTPSAGAWPSCRRTSAAPHSSPRRPRRRLRRRRCSL
jgi:hypothetical protein